MALADKKLTDLTELVAVPAGAFIHVVDPTDISQSPQGSSYKVKKENFGGLSDAPIDGEIYGRKDGSWTGIASDLASVFTPLTRTITINGVTQDLSANRTFTVVSGVLHTTKTATSSNLATQDLAGFLTYVNGVTSFAIAANEIVKYNITDTGQIFEITVNNRSVGSGETALTSSDVLFISAKKPFRIVQTTSSSTLTGTTSDTKLVQNILIPAGTVKTGDIFHLKIRMSRTVPTSGSTNISGCISSVSGETIANLITNNKITGDFYTGTNRYLQIDHDLFVKSATVTTAINNQNFFDNVTSINTTTRNIDWTVNQYFYVIVSNTQTDTVSFVDGYALELIRSSN